MTTCVNELLGADTDIDDDDNRTGECGSAFESSGYCRDSGQADRQMMIMRQKL